MTKVYACLIGNWVCLNDDPNCVVGKEYKDPSSWWKNDASVYAPTTRDDKYENSLCGLDYVELRYNGKDYRINPLFIQIVTE